MQEDVKSKLEEAEIRHRKIQAEHNRARNNYRILLQAGRESAAKQMAQEYTARTGREITGGKND